MSCLRVGYVNDDHAIRVADRNATQIVGCAERPGFDQRFAEDYEHAWLVQIPKFADKSICRLAIIAAGVRFNVGRQCRTTLPEDRPFIQPTVGRFMREHVVHRQAAHRISDRVARTIVQDELGKSSVDNLEGCFHFLVLNAGQGHSRRRGYVDSSTQASMPLL